MELDCVFDFKIDKRSASSSVNIVNFKKNEDKALDNIHIESMNTSLGALLEKIKKSIFSKNQKQAVDLIQLVPPSLTVDILQSPESDASDYYNLREFIILKLQMLSYDTEWFQQTNLTEKKVSIYLNIFFDQVVDIDQSFQKHIKNVNAALDKAG